MPPSLTFFLDASLVASFDPEALFSASGSVALIGVIATTVHKIPADEKKM